MLFQFFPGFSSASQALLYLESFGLTSTLVPFALIFAIVYTFVHKSNVLENAAVKVIVSLAITVTTVLAHILSIYPPTADPVVLINTSLPQIAFIFVIAVLAKILYSLFGGTGSAFSSSTMTWAAIAIFAFIFMNSLTQGSALSLIYSWISNPIWFAILIVIAFFALIIFVVMRDGPLPPPPPPS